MPTSFTLIAAKASDARRLSALAIQVFLDTYAPEGVDGSLAAEALELNSVDVFAARLADPGVRIHLAERAGRVIGFTDLIMSSVGAHPQARGAEVLRLYIQPAQQRIGAGRSLLAWAEDCAREHGAAALWLTAWAGNHRALAFYAALGYADVGATDYVFQGQRFENRALVKRLTEV